MSQKINLPLEKLDDLFSTQSERDDSHLEKVVNIPIDSIDDFKNHPFKVEDDDELEQLKESINEKGVLNPTIVTFGISLETTSGTPKNLSILLILSPFLSFKFIYRFKFISLFY